MAERYTSIRDMFDGGGAGQSGAQFEGGGFLSAAANAIARPQGSVERGDADMRTGFGGFLRDAVNGGGWGASGSTFSGGLLSPFANAFGVKPMGEQQRMADAQAQLQGQLAEIYARRNANAAPAQPAAGMTVPDMGMTPVSDMYGVAFPDAATGPMPSTELGFGMSAPTVSNGAPTTSAPAVGRQIIPSGGDDVAKFYRDLILGADEYGIPAAGDAGYYNYLRTGRF